MTATRSDVQSWLNTGIDKGATHVIIAYDDFDEENYPMYIMPGDNAKDFVKAYDKKPDRIDEVYNLSMDIEEQLNSIRAYNI
ncbi:hypothetical protein M3_0120 [Lysinibacillus phage vB_LfM_LysYB1]|nr:hypothetical protein M3_0120 [Lysinibacillus phage vB_LfM_LysYB1]WAB25370.1 hypothetical protein M5_0192 [Lysinibacillus phage vB_LfM_LysYB2]